MKVSDDSMLTPPPPELKGLLVDIILINMVQCALLHYYCFYCHYYFLNLLYYYQFLISLAFPSKLFPKKKHHSKLSKTSSTNSGKSLIYEKNNFVNEK